jgi:Tol biopolymer transport system component
MRCRFQLVLLAGIAAATSSSVGALSQAAPDTQLVGTVRGSILVADYRGIYRRYASGALKQLTSTTAGQYDLYPVWSRAGTRIAFERITLPHKSCPLMVMNSDGSDLHQVAQVATDCSGASWGPNDDQLVFVSGPQFGNGASLRIVNLDGTGLRNLLRGRGANPGGTHPTWSPDGRTIVFGWSAGRVSGLLAIRPDGTHLRALVKRLRGNPEMFAGSTWSRDGKRLAFVRVDLIARRRTITVATSGGMRRHAVARLPLNPGGVGNPSWSPNDSLIAFDGQCGQQACVWTIPSRGGIRQVLIRGVFLQPSWGPAGT